MTATKKVAIVGCSQSKGLAPYDDAGFEIWGVNNLFPHIPRASRWFEIHHIEQLNGVYYRRGDRKFRGQEVGEYLAQLGAWAKEKECVVYTQTLLDMVPTAVPYPLDAMVQRFGGYFTNSISWMLALAIAEEFEEIHVYGVDMAVDTEYHHQRPSCEYFLGIAVGLGIKIYIPSQADLLKTRFLYGFQEPMQREWSKKIAAMRNTIGEKRARIEREIGDLKAQIKLREGQIHQFVGAEHALVESNKVWS